MGQVLIAFDTNHIKRYVVETDRLKEIRGASSLLDKLNRVDMIELAKGFSAPIICANGGSGLFLVDTKEQAELFGQRVQRRYREMTSGRASITYAIQELPPITPDDDKDVWLRDLQETLALMRYRLREAKDRSQDIITLPSHPFMRPCDACGVAYAEKKDSEPGERAGLYCDSCLRKRHEDLEVKKRIPLMIQARYVGNDQNAYLWERLIIGLKKGGYTIPEGTERPGDFDIFRNFLRSKDYLGVIYADANNMGKRMEELGCLGKVKQVAEDVDNAIYDAVVAAIKQHLPVYAPSNQSKDNPPLFPFDVLLMGGDDIVMVTDATKAIDVALTLANTFFEETKKKDEQGRGGTLSVGVVLVPIKYPFGLSLDLVESTLKFAKKEGAKRQRKAGRVSTEAVTLINFMTVLGNTGRDFTTYYNFLKSDKKHNIAGKNIYATLRPYEPEQLQKLVTAIHEGHRKGLGRTKLYQLREAIAKKNMSTAVSDARAISRTWHEAQRNFVYELLYDFAMPYQAIRSDIENPTSMLYHIPFPWFADGEDTYRTMLLDFIELYDFVTEDNREGAN